jgi:hypothetical protein
MSKEQIGKSVYGALAVAVLASGFYHLDIDNDLGFIPFFLWVGAMVLLSFPIGIISVPLSLLLSFGVVYVLTAIFGYPFDGTMLAGAWFGLFIIIAWLLMFAAGYWQWFKLIPKLDGRVWAQPNKSLKPTGIS